MSRRGSARCQASTVVALALLCAASAAHAWDPLVGDGEERALLEAVRADKLIRAREKAETILRRRPGSFIARYALVLVFHDEEANLPRALYHARRAERWLLRRYGDPPRGELARTWHRRLLKEQEELLGELDRRKDQLALLDRHDKLYRPKLDYRRIWALMKLGRYDEAMVVARRVAGSKQANRRVSGLNGMIAIEMERQRPKACYQAGLRAIEATGGRSCILLHNTAEAAFAVFKFQQVERLANRALQAPVKDCPNSSYTHLANLYLLKGDFQRAMGAVKSAREQGVRRRYRQQFEMENSGWLLRLLYALGKFDKALELAQRTVTAPDREGMTSTSSELGQVVNMVEYHAALQAQLEALREQASSRPLTTRLRLWLRRQKLERKAWTARRRVARLVASEVRLRKLVRPYFTPLVPWNAGALVGVLGQGVTLRALKVARAKVPGDRTAGAYFDALEAEVAHRAGAPRLALTLADRALSALPKEERLLRARVQAVAAAAAGKLGQRRRQVALLQTVLNAFPTALRLLQVTIPARIVADARPLSQAVARALHRSPRLTDGSAFTVRVTGRGSLARACLEDSRGQRFGCAEVELKQKKDLPEEQQVALVADAFHGKVFAPKIDLTQKDINSLDGSAVRGDADMLLNKVLGK